MFRAYRVLRGAAGAPQPVLRRKMGGGSHAPPPEGGLDGLVRKYLPENHHVWIYYSLIHSLSLIHALIYSFFITHSRSHLFVLYHSFTLSLTHSLTHALIYSLGCHGSYRYVLWFIYVIKISIWWQEEASCSACHRWSQSWLDSYPSNNLLTLWLAYSLNCY